MLFFCVSQLTLLAEGQTELRDELQRRGDEVTHGIVKHSTICIFRQHCGCALWYFAISTTGVFSLCLFVSVIFVLVCIPVCLCVFACVIGSMGHCGLQNCTCTCRSSFCTFLDTRSFFLCITADPSGRRSNGVERRVAKERR